MYNFARAKERRGRQSCDGMVIIKLFVRPVITWNSPRPAQYTLITHFEQHFIDTSSGLS